MLMQAVMALLPPALIAGVVMLLAWRPWKRGAPLLRGEWGSALAIGSGFICGFLIQTGWAALHLKQRWHWLLPMIAAATALATIAALWRPRGWMKWLPPAATAICAAAMLHPIAAAGSPMLWKLSLAVVILLYCAVLVPLAQRRAGASLPLAFSLVFAGLSAILLQGRMATFSLIAAAVATTLAAITIIAWLNPRVSLANGAVIVLAPILAAMIATGWFYREAGSVLALSFVLLAVAPLFLWLGEIAALCRLKPWIGAAIRAAIVLVPVALAAALAIMTE